MYNPSHFYVFFLGFSFRAITVSSFKESWRNISSGFSSSGKDHRSVMSDICFPIVDVELTLGAHSRLSRSGLGPTLRRLGSCCRSRSQSWTSLGQLRPTRHGNGVGGGRRASHSAPCCRPGPTHVLSSLSPVPSFGQAFT